MCQFSISLVSVTRVCNPSGGIKMGLKVHLKGTSQSWLYGQVTKENRFGLLKVHDSFQSLQVFVWRIHGINNKSPPLWERGSH
ncbi:hypothetical protein Hanom_Chr11g01021941 [Helianthus anomalus]